MLSTAWAQLRRHPHRIIAVMLAIVLGVGFTAASLVFTATFDAGLRRAVSAESSQADVLIAPGDSGTPAAASLAAVRRQPGVAVAEELMHSGGRYATSTTRGSLTLSTVPTRSAVALVPPWPRATGPAAATEILVDRGDPRSRPNCRWGAQVTLIGWADGATVAATVVGIVDTSSSAPDRRRRRCVRAARHCLPPSG